LARFSLFKDFLIIWTWAESEGGTIVYLSGVYEMYIRLSKRVKGYLKIEKCMIWSTWEPDIRAILEIIMSNINI